ncbi:hypothetical protein TNCV_3222481 [Trichonephila clavipes]|nr:hypothetical protein TNCV_3222481 [Trichonephila clavipes]
MHGGGLFARRPVRCVPFNACPSEKVFSAVQSTTGIGDNEWGQKYSLQMTADSVLNSDSHRIPSGKSGEAAIIPRTSY